MKMKIRFDDTGELKQVQEAPAKKAELKKTEPQKKQEPAEETAEQKEKPEKNVKKGRILTAVLILVMLVGIGVFAMGLMSFLENRRMEEQGAPEPVYESEETLDTYLQEDGTETQISNTPIEDSEEAGSEEGTEDVSEEGTEDVSGEDAENEAAYLEQQLQNAEDMLDASLAREEALQQQLQGE